MKRTNRKGKKELLKKEYLRPVEAARILGVSYHTLRMWIKTNKIKAIMTLGGKYRIPVSEIKRIMRGRG